MARVVWLVLAFLATGPAVAQTSKLADRVAAARKAAVRSEAFLAALQDKHVFVREAALASLTRHTARTAAVRAALGKALDDQSPLVRRAAVETLGRLKLGGRVFVASLTKKLDDRTWYVAETAALSLGRLRARQALDPLGKLAADTVGRRAWSKGARAVRDAAAWALGQLGKPALPALMKAMAWRVYPALFRAVAALGPMALPALKKQLTQRGYDRREQARVLLYLGRWAIPFIVQLLEGKDTEVSYQAAVALGRLRVGRPRAVAGLVKRIALRDYSQGWRDCSGEKCLPTVTAVALARIGRPAITPLRKLIASKKSGSFWRGAEADVAVAVLARIGKPALGALYAALDVDSESVRGAALKALMNLKARRHIQRAARHRRAEVRKAARALVTKLGGGDAWAVWLRQLADKDSSVRREAARTIRAQKGWEKQVARLFGRQKPKVQREICAVLAKTGHGAWGTTVVEPLRGTLVKATRSRHQAVRHVALDQLLSEKKDPKTFVALVERALQDRAPATRAMGLSHLARAVGDGRPSAGWDLERLRRLSQGAFRRALRDPRTRSKALQSLPGSMVRSFSRTLAALVRRGPTKLRLEAIGAINSQYYTSRHHGGSFSPPDPDVVRPALIRTLGSANKEIRVAACAAIASLSPRAHQAVAPLKRLLKAREAEVRVAAVEALASVAGGTDDLGAVLRALNDREAQVRQAVVTALESQALEPAHVRRLASALSDPDEDVRSRTLSALEQLGPSATPALPTLIQAFNRSPTDDLVEAIAATGAPAALAVLIRALDHKDDEIREDAAEGIADHFKKKGKAAVPALSRALSDKESDVRDEALKALDKIGAPVALSALLKGIRAGASDERELTRLLRPHGERATRSLAPLLADKNRDIRRIAAWVLKSLRSERLSLLATRAFRKALSDEDRRVRALAAAALARAHPEDLARAVPALGKALGDKNDSVRLAVAQTLRRLGKRAKAARKQLEQAVDDSEWKVAREAIEALGAMGASSYRSALLLAFKPSRRHPEDQADDDDYMSDDRQIAGTLATAERRWYAAAKLAKTKGPSMLPRLVAELRRTKSKLAPEPGALALVAYGKPGVAALVGFLKSNRTNLKQGIVDALPKMEINKHTIELFLLAVRLAPAKSRHRAVRALARIRDKEPKRVKAAAFAVLADASAAKGRVEVRRAAVEILKHFKTPDVVRALRWALTHHKSTEVIKAAAEALRGFGKVARRAAPELAALLPHRDPDLRWAGAVGLSYVGAKRGEHAAGLLKQLVDPSFNVRVGASWALIDLADASILKPMMSAYRTATHCFTRENLLLARSRLKVKSPRWPGLVFDAFGDPCMEVRRTACEILGAERRAEGRAAARARKALELGLLDREIEVNAPAAVALIQLGIQSKRATRLLREWMTDARWDPHNSEKRLTAIKALSALEDRAAPFLPELERALSDRNCDLRRETIVVLGKLRGRASRVKRLLGTVRPKKGCDLGAEVREALETLKRPATPSGP